MVLWNIYHRYFVQYYSIDKEYAKKTNHERYAFSYHRRVVVVIRGYSLLHRDLTQFPHANATFRNNSNNKL